MNFTLVQLEYILAIDVHKSFSIASQNCFVTQPTLSMQVQKLELNLGVQLFDRSKKPVMATEIGRQIIAQARVILQEANRITEIINTEQNEIVGDLKLGVIPTIAPYVLPLFIRNFTQRYPKVRLIVEELLTEQIVERLNNDLIDCGLLVTPLEEKTLTTIPLFYEPFMLYLSPKHILKDNELVNASDLDLANLWLLNEGHCFASQVINICNQSEQLLTARNFEYKSGSLETLQRLVEQQDDNHTLLPQLAIQQMNEDKKQFIRNFTQPEPVREVSLVVHRSFLKKRLIEALQKEILSVIPLSMQEKTGKNIVKI
jgi:LysR family hydrogen peroxide-inducible transcriptional activator